MTGFYTDPRQNPAQQPQCRSARGTARREQLRPDWRTVVNDVWVVKVTGGLTGGEFTTSVRTDELNRTSTGINGAAWTGPGAAHACPGGSIRSRTTPRRRGRSRPASGGSARAFGDSGNRLTIRTTAWPDITIARHPRTGNLSARRHPCSRVRRFLALRTCRSRNTRRCRRLESRAALDGRSEGMRQSSGSSRPSVRCGRLAERG
jgi:hypothetical protein